MLSLQKANHLAPDCYFKNATCNYCKLQGDLECVYREKKSKALLKTAEIISVCDGTNASNNFCRLPKLQIPVYINFQEFRMELDTATGGNFNSQEVWKKLGKPDLEKVWKKSSLPISICKSAFTARFRNFCHSNYSGS